MADKRTGKSRQGTHPKAPTPRVLPGAKALYKTSSGQAAKQVISKAAKNNQRVSVKVKLKDGSVREMWKDKGGHHGASAGFVNKKIGTTAGHLKGALATQAEQYDSDEVEEAAFEVDEIDEIQVLVYL